MDQQKVSFIFHTYLHFVQPTNTALTFNPNRSLDYYAQTNFLFVICLSVFRLQWNPIAPSKRRDIWTKTRVVIIITLMTDLGLKTQQPSAVFTRRPTAAPPPPNKSAPLKSVITPYWDLSDIWKLMPTSCPTEAARVPLWAFGFHPCAACANSAADGEAHPSTNRHRAVSHWTNRPYPSSMVNKGHRCWNILFLIAWTMQFSIIWWLQSR